MLIRHIPNTHFKNIRYYGLYAAKNHKYRDNYYLLYNQVKKSKDSSTGNSLQVTVPNDKELIQAVIRVL